MTNKITFTQLHDINSGIRQKFARKLVEEDIIHCASNMIYELSSKSDLIYDNCSFGELHSEILSAQYTTTEVEYCCPKCSGQTDTETKYHDEYLEEDDLKPFEGECLDCEYSGVLDPEIEHNEDNYHEALEHWIVSAGLGERLQAHGEMIGEVFDFTIWGRTCSGQSIELDSVMQSIAFELWKSEMIQDQLEYDQATRETIPA